MIEYKEINGTSYHKETQQEIIDILENARESKRSYRLKIYYGDTETGKAWGDIVNGYIGRSTGTRKIPLVINNKKSWGGSAVLDSCIVKIEYANKKNGGILYQHPNFYKE